MIMVHNLSLITTSTAIIKNTSFFMCWRIVFYLFRVMANERAMTFKFGQYYSCTEYFCIELSILNYQPPNVETNSKKRSYSSKSRYKPKKLAASMKSIRAKR